MNSAKKKEVSSIVSSAVNRAIVEAVRNAQGVVIDDHKHNGETMKIDGFVITYTSHGHEVVCPYLDNTVFCLNPLEMDDNGRVHLSRWSIGGNIHSADVDGVTACRDLTHVSGIPAIFMEL